LPYQVRSPPKPLNGVHSCRVETIEYSFNALIVDDNPFAEMLCLQVGLKFFVFGYLFAQMSHETIRLHFLAILHFGGTNNPPAYNISENVFVRHPRRHAAQTTRADRLCRGPLRVAPRQIHLIRYSLSLSHGW
jgi:hypothetical protein